MSSALQPRRSALLSGLLDAWRSHGPTGIYMIKVCLAAFITYWFALRLELPAPRTCLITVFIVMQPQSGSVLAKGVFRLLGTFVGLAVTVALFAVVGQYGQVYLGCLAVWVGICCFFSARHRNFTAYAFVLAGYTAAIVGAGALSHPQGVFMSALWRAMEISLAIVCSSAVSAVVFPERAEDSLRNTLRGRFAAFNQFACEQLEGAGSPASFAAGNRRFIGEAVRLESLRTLAVFEAPAVRQRSNRLRRVNSEFMVTSTRLNALLHWLTYLREQGRDDVLQALQPHLIGVQRLLRSHQGQVFSAQLAEAFAQQLLMFRATLPGAASQPLDPDLATGLELLGQFCADLHDYALTHASLTDNRHPREAWSHPFAPSTALWVSLASGVRGALVVATASAFWVLTAFPSGVPLVLCSAAAVSLTAAAPNPRKAGVQMAIGAILGAVLGTLETFVVFPMIDGFPLLCMVMTPVFLLGAWLTTRMSTFGIGLGTLIVFASGGVPDNLTAYNAAPFINDYIATVVAFGLAAAAGAVILPTNGRWLWRHLQAQLRHQMRFALQAKLPAVRWHFESRTRDILQHASAVTGAEPHAQQALLGWLLSVQQVGHALIELRLDAQASTDTPTAPQRKVGTALAKLYDHPTRKHRQQAITAVEEALEQPGQSQRALSYLLFIKVALLDSTSPLASLI